MAFSIFNKNSFEEDEPIVAEINITPLVDVFLVLLIIFMLTTSVMGQMGMEVSLPKSSNEAASDKPEGVIVTLLPNGEIKLNQENLGQDGIASLEPKLHALLEKTSKKVVILEGDEKAKLGSAVKIFSVAKKAGATGFAIATDTENSKN